MDFRLRGFLNLGLRTYDFRLAKTASRQSLKSEVRGLKSLIPWKSEVLSPKSLPGESLLDDFDASWNRLRGKAGIDVFNALLWNDFVFRTL